MPSVYVDELLCYYKNKRIIFPIFVRQVFLPMLYYLLMFLILRTSLLPTALCVRFVVLTDAVTRLAWQQHQANVNAAAEAAALRAMHEESARLAGEPNGGRVA